VQILSGEDLASDTGPEPCVVSREGQGEASEGDRAGWLSSRESALSRVTRRLPTRKATRAAALTRATETARCVGRARGGYRGSAVNWILDADIEGFFDTTSHDWMMRFVEHRVGDRRVLRLIGGWRMASG
jgi:hypothetical protein